MRAAFWTTMIGQGLSLYSRFVYRLELCAAADILLTPPPPITDRRAAAADQMLASRR